MIISHFSQAELAFRWRISPRTLERWRWSKTGPVFLKIGGRVIYRLEDIEAFEKASIRHAVSRGGATCRKGAQSPHIAPQGSQADYGGLLLGPGDSTFRDQSWSSGI